LRILKSFVFILLVFFLFPGCAASSAGSRFNIRNSEDWKKNKSVSSDTSKYNFKRLMTVENPDDLDSKNDVLLEDDDDEFDALETGSSALNKNEVFNNLLKLTSTNIPSTISSKILSEAVYYLNTPYKYGGSSERGIDCSAFTQKVFLNSIELQIPRTAREQFLIGEKISKDEVLDFGDLVFFKTKRRSTPSHVGIYIGENKFMHASRKKGVMVSSLEEKYWVPRYIGARRLSIKE
jgi:murein DD-endopeptidase / murein LD-carboxypeptidase